jgi:hypothetical protein
MSSIRKSRTPIPVGSTSCTERSSPAAALKGIVLSVTPTLVNDGILEIPSDRIFLSTKRLE